VRTLVMHAPPYLCLACGTLNSGARQKLLQTPQVVARSNGRYSTPIYLVPTSCIVAAQHLDGAAGTGIMTAARRRGPRWPELARVCVLLGGDLIHVKFVSLHLLLLLLTPVISLAIDLSIIITHHSHRCIGFLFSFQQLSTPLPFRSS